MVSAEMVMSAGPQAARSHSASAAGKRCSSQLLIQESPPFLKTANRSNISCPSASRCYQSEVTEH